MCVCPNCGLRLPKPRGVPCGKLVCCNCGTKMVEVK